MKRPPSLLPYIFWATSCLMTTVTTRTTAATVTVNVTHLCDTRPAVAPTTRATRLTIEDIGMTPSSPSTKNPTSWSSSSSSPLSEKPVSLSFLQPPTENQTSWSSLTDNLTSLSSLPPTIENTISWSPSPPTNKLTGLSLAPSSSGNLTTLSSSLSTENQMSSLLPTENRSSSAAHITEFLFAVRKPGMVDFTYASRTTVQRRSSSSPNASAGPVALKQIATFPSVKFGENVKLDQQTSQSNGGAGSGTATAIGLFGVGIVVGDVGLRFIGVAEDLIMWHSMPAELILDLFSNPYEWDIVAKKVTKITHLRLL